MGEAPHTAPAGVIGTDISCRAGGRLPVSIENLVNPTEAVTEPHPINRRLEKSPPMKRY